MYPIYFIKKLRMKFTLFIIAICIFVLSCKKDSSSNDKTTQLTSADWKYDTGGIGDANGNILFDFNTTGAIPACSLDNTIRFNSNGNGVVSENANVCTGAPATTAFTWSLSSDQSILNVSGGAVAGLGGSFKIKTLSGTRLSLLKDTSYLGTSVTAIVNLKH
jgi:hypothetical protein